MIETEQGGRGRKKNQSDGEKEKQYPQHKQRERWWRREGVEGGIEEACE